jgi:hypothetical protein
MSAEQQRCQWIEGEPSRNDACKCGRRIARNASVPYCRTHLKRAYLPESSWREMRRARDRARRLGLLPSRRRLSRWASRHGGQWAGL